ncbi:MAG TPA: hypothetical protein VJS12_14855 [Steroidobacteraceae bacterium]|nr:hypothetical protein [Steroidobacteraceae bacterium]
MTFGATDEQIDRELRRRQLAKRLTAHQARTQTICAMTALTRHQLTTLRQRWKVPQKERYRGPAPRSFNMFTKTLRGQAEGAALYVLCRVLGALSGAKPSRNDTLFDSAEAGERLCDVVEVCRLCFPQLQADFGQIQTLALGVAAGERVVIANCINCSALIVVERLSTRRRLCAHCRRARRELPEPLPESDIDKSLEGNQSGDDMQQSLF